MVTPRATDFVRNRSPRAKALPRFYLCTLLLGAIKPGGHNDGVASRQSAVQFVGIAAFLEVVAAHNSDPSEDADMRRFCCDVDVDVAATGPSGSDTESCGRPGAG